LHLQAKDFPNPGKLIGIAPKRTVNSLETASAIGNVPIQIRRHPVDGADDSVYIEDDSLDDSEMKDANTGLASTFHSFDGNAIPWLYF